MGTMNIEYKLVENETMVEPGQRVARICSRGTADFEAVIDDMLDHGSSVSRSDILGVLEEYHRSIERLVLSGMTVLTPLANYRAGLHGVFTGETDTFDPARHQAVGLVSAGRRLRSTIHDRAQLTRIDKDERHPWLRQYQDVLTGRCDAVLTPGGPGRLTGRYMKFDPADAVQGIFLIATDETETRVEVVIENLPRKLIFTVPALAPGEYRLEVRTRANPESEVRSGALSKRLLVS